MDDSDESGEKEVRIVTVVIRRSTDARTTRRWWPGTIRSVGWSTAGALLPLLHARPVTNGDVRETNLRVTTAYNCRLGTHDCRQRLSHDRPLVARPSCPRFRCLVYGGRRLVAGRVTRRRCSRLGPSFCSARRDVGVHTDLVESPSYAPTSRRRWAAYSAKEMMSWRPFRHTMSDNVAWWMVRFETLSLASV